MDLGAYTNKFRKKVEEWFNPIPRPRGVRLMFFEKKDKDTPDYFNKYCGKDVIYIHTRCGGYNYEENKMGEFESMHNCLHGENDEHDSTYRDSYFPIPEAHKKAYELLKKKLIVKRLKE